MKQIILATSLLWMFLQLTNFSFFILVILNKLVAPVWVWKLGMFSNSILFFFITALLVQLLREKLMKNDENR